MKPQAVDKDPRRIRTMFAGIARRYDALNHLLSLNVDRSWRRTAARLIDPRPGELLLDLCTGTADLALELSRSGGGDGGARVIGTDFCPEMLRIGEGKRRRRGAPVRLAAADALRLPFAAERFHAASVAFGIRNLSDLDLGLGEILRILRPGGRAVILEFTTPTMPGFRNLFGFYFHRVLPRLGRLVSRSPDPVAGRAYSYLPDSVRQFPDADGLAAAMTRAGFVKVGYRRLTMGIACIHSGEKQS